MDIGKMGDGYLKKNQNIGVLRILFIKMRVEEVLIVVVVK